MIRVDLARRFIERVSKYTDYNVNIMDEQGIIIASRDPERLGQYHAVAHQVILSGKDILEAETGYGGNVHRGLNMVIEVDGRREGVVGVTGDPEEIRPAALMTKMAIETMLRYERQQEERRRRENRKEQFIYLLTQVEEADHNELRSLASELGFPEERIRIPILMAADRPGDTEDLLMRVRAGHLHTPQDFSIAPDDRHVLIFKTIPDQGDLLMSQYREFLLEYLSDIRGVLAREGRQADFYIGSFQENYKQYYHSYRHCKWLESQVPASGEVVFFYDHMNEYIQQIAPMQELRSVYHIYEKRLPEKMRRTLIETALTLQKHNFNFSRSAEELFVHKNTLVYRYNQIRELMGIDPVNSAEDRMLLVAFAVYLNRLNK